jgi:hypothetical protein
MEYSAVAPVVNAAETAAMNANRKREAIGISPVRVWTIE